MKSNASAVSTKNNRTESARLETIETKRKIHRCTRRTVGMNQHIKAAVVRLAVDSPLEPPLRTVAKYAHVSERQAWDILLDEIRDLRAAVSFRPATCRA